jgi:predicted ABC-type ATPase
MPTLHVLAGPNGAGKTTLYEAEVKPANPLVEFVNADRLAAAHFGHHASTEEEAKKGQALADGRRAVLMGSGKSLVTESTFSHPSKLRLIQEALDLGYRVAVYHVNVRSAELSIERVKDRVGRGGHDVPEDRIRGRYERNKALIKTAVLMADRGQVFDNSRLGQPPELALKFERGQLTYASDRVPAWAKDLYADQLEHYSASRLNPAAASFEQARLIAQKVLGEDAKTYVAKERALYRGEIIGQTALHTLQRVNAATVVAHFTERLKDHPSVGRYASIEYSKGESKASVTSRPARAVAFERQTEQEATARFPELKTAYGIMRTFEDEGRASGKITDANVGQFRATLKLKMTSALDSGKLPKLLERGIVKPERPSPDRGR